MKTALKYLSIVGLVGLTLAWPSLWVSSTQGDEASAIEENPAAREAFYHLQLQDENGVIDLDGRYNALAQKELMDFIPGAWDEFVQGYPPTVPGWTAIGPGNIGGRTRSILIHPANPATMWLGAVAGGVWKTTNGGASWSTNTDALSNLAIMCMVMDPANPNVLYAGTGEGTFISDYLRGNGIYKSTDGGSTWTALASTVAQPQFYWVNRLAICPTNSQLILAATQLGMVRSVNGGTSWTGVLGTLGVLDVDFQPSAASIRVPGLKCLAGTRAGGAYYSNNSGQTWVASTGLPANPGRTEVAYSPSNPVIAYASVETNGQLYRSIDSGLTFTLAGAPPGGTSASWHNNSLWVDPTNSNTVIVGGEDLWRTTDGGLSWTKQTSQHPDHHVIIQHPAYNGTTNTTVFEGNDGGIYQTTNVLAPTVTWQELNNTLAITQFYGAAGNATSGTIIGGTQDNGTVRFRPQDGSENWHTMFGGDGGFCAADPTDPNFFYGEYIFLQIYRSTDGAYSADYIYNGLTDAGSRANFIAPFVLDHNNPNTLLAGGASLWRSKNVKDTEPAWSPIKSPLIPNCTNNCVYISAILVAPGDSNTVWVGYNDGSVYRTTNGTATTPTWIQADTGLPHRMCTRIAMGPPAGLVVGADPDDPQVGSTVYAMFGGFSSNNVWKTSNGGTTWEPIHNNLPDVPVFSLVVSPSNSSRLYLGTEIGVFASADGGSHWSPEGPAAGGPANTRVDELFLLGNKLVAATHGRGMYTLGQ